MSEGKQQAPSVPVSSLPVALPASLTVRQVAERLGCSISMVWELIAVAKLRAFRLGDRRGVRVPGEAVEAFIRAREIAPTKASDGR